MNKEVILIVGSTSWWKNIKLRKEAAQNLFAAMRALDEQDLDLILAERMPDHGLGKAINDRLNRAAAK